MNPIRKGIPTARTQAIVGATLFGIVVFLTVMASRTGQTEFDDAKQRLDQVETLNLRLDGSMFLSMFELQMDFDVITDLEKELRLATERYAAVLAPGDAAPLVEAMGRKLELVEDYKSAQAVLRNSRAIAAQTLEEMWDLDALRDRDLARGLFAVERAFLNFAARRDPPSAANLRVAVEAAKADQEGLTALAEWPVLEAHVSTLTRYVERVGLLLQENYLIPMLSLIHSQTAGLTDRLAVAAAVAGRYRIALFVVAVVLLAFSVSMVTQTRRYLRMIESSNNELEARVAKRTGELASANKALRYEIAERENVEAQLQMAQKLEAIGQLAAGIAHEINTPTQYVNDNVAFLENVWRDLEPLVDDYERSVLTGDIDVARSRAVWGATDVAFLRAEVPAALEQASVGLAQIGKIVLAMRSFSHPGSDGLHPADINKAIESTVTVARNEWKYVANLSLVLDENLPAVPCDVSAFNQALLNLVVNAAQAIGEVRRGDAFGHITVSSRLIGEHAEICVQDDGPGVPENIRHRIFDPFFTTKEVGKGTGQGLAIAHRVIHRQHGGTLTLETSLADKGARFVIRLPLRVADGAPAANGTAARDAHGTLPEPLEAAGGRR